MIKINTPPLGIIEGFFGRNWSWQERNAHIHFLALNALNFYIYAPKSDAYLRKHWQQDWPADIKQELIQLRETCQQNSIDFGIGLSPFEIYLDNSHRKRTNLIQRIKQINNLSPDILCLLFDDMRGDIPDLANIQVDLVHEAAANTNARKIIFCPTYYSFDPVLEKVFGKMPDNYWQDLQKNLDPAIDIFWTGEKVCSTEYPSKHLNEVTSILGRKPFLWDNYPVNDSALKCNFLHLRAVEKCHALIQQQVAGHALNPMNQPWLSQLAIASLPIAYQEKNNYDPRATLEKILLKVCDGEIAKQLLKDLHLFQDQGLKQISQPEKFEIIQRYSQFPDNIFCREIIEWLNGGYTFDPACLTE